MFSIFKRKKEDKVSGIKFSLAYKEGWNNLCEVVEEVTDMSKRDFTEFLYAVQDYDRDSQLNKIFYKIINDEKYKKSQVTVKIFNTVSENYSVVTDYNNDRFEEDTQFALDKLIKEMLELDK